jgi:hypothetical protein
LKFKQIKINPYTAIAFYLIDLDTTTLDELLNQLEKTVEYQQMQFTFSMEDLEAGVDVIQSRWLTTYKKEIRNAIVSRFG